jgi:NOL1/NOP2/fmu family ribosome biogenesis protein
LYVGEIKKNRFEPSQSLAMALTKDEFDNCLDLSADDTKVIKYLKGETIDFDDTSVKNGYVLVCVDGYPLGFGKASQGVLKNKYLPGWRLMS